MAYIGRDIDKISNVEVLDNITFDGSSSYTLQKGGSNFTPSSANTLLVSIDGVVQAGNFTVSGSTINFGTAVSASSTCNFILHYGVGLITAPADGTVTTAKLADSSVTTAKLNDASVSLAKLTATGTKDATTFLRGDNTFASPSSPSGGAFSLVTRTAITSDVSSVSFTGLTANVIHHFQLNAIDSTNNGGEDLLLRVSTDGGSSYQTSGYYNSLWQHYSSGSTNNQTKTDALLSLNDGMTQSGTDEGVNGFVYIYNIGNSAQKVMAIGNTVSVADANYLRSNHMGGIYDTAANVTAVQFLFDTGNISGSTKAFITHYEQVIA